MHVGACDSCAGGLTTTSMAWKYSIEGPLPLICSLYCTYVSGGNNKNWVVVRSALVVYMYMMKIFPGNRVTMTLTSLFLRKVKTNVRIVRRVGRGFM